MTESSVRKEDIIADAYRLIALHRASAKMKLVHSSNGILMVTDSVPHLTRSQLAKVSFPTFEAADRKRKEIESLYPKRFSKRYAAAMIQSKDDARISRSATLTKPLRVDGPFKVPRPPTVKSEHPSSGAPFKVPRPPTVKSEHPSSGAPFKVPRPPTVKSEHPSSGAPSKVPRPPTVKSEHPSSGAPSKVPRPPTVKSEHPSSGAPSKVPRPPTVKSEHPSSGAPSKVPRPL
eukprot:g2074.t1